jgi:hypothetical protein
MHVPCQIYKQLKYKKKVLSLMSYRATRAGICLPQQTAGVGKPEKLKRQTSALQDARSD